MRKDTAITWILVVSAVSLALGFAGGAEYVMRRVDALDGARAAAQQKTEAARQDDWNKLELTLKNSQQAADVLGTGFTNCRAQFDQSTVIYERAPQLTLGFSGIRGLPVIPIGAQGDEAPHWLIPAKIKPMVLGDSRGAVYYYMTRDNRMDGPYLPEVFSGK